jgi:HD-like signal output (HDOD) protein
MRDIEAAIGELLARDEVPVVPWRGVAVRVLALLERGDFAVEDVVRLVSSDPGMAVRVLAAAAACSGGEAPASLALAVARIGVPPLLAVAREAATDGLAAGPLDALRRAAWRDAVGTAMLAAALARARGLDGDAAWLCGLLHDVGRLAALSLVERLACGTRGAFGPGLRSQRCVERWRVSIGVAVAERHGLPRAVAEVVALDGSADPAPGRALAFVRVVRSASAIARAVREEAPLEGDAAALEDMTDAEADRLAAAVAALPSAVAALEARPAGRAAPAGGAADADGDALGDAADAAGGDDAGDTTLHESRGEGVRLRLAGQEYVATGVAPLQLVVAGPAPLGVGAVLEVEILERRRRVFHVRVLECWAEGERFGAILAPFALGWREAVAWEGRTVVGARA